MFSLDSVREEEGILLEIREEILLQRTQVTANGIISLMMNFIVKYCWGLKSLGISLPFIYLEAWVLSTIEHKLLELFKYNWGI